MRDGNLNYGHLHLARPALARSRSGSRGCTVGGVGAHAALPEGVLHRRLDGIDTAGRIIAAGSIRVLVGICPILLVKVAQS
jgi:hypothetical protein